MTGPGPGLLDRNHDSVTASYGELHDNQPSDAHHPATTRRPR